MNIGSLFMTLGFNVDDKKAKEFKDGIVSLRNELFKVSGIAAGAAYAVNRFVSGSSREAVSMKNLADQTGLATDEMQRFYNAASAVNSEITFDNAIGTLRQLEDTIAQINFGEGPIGSAAFLGVRINQDTDSMDVIRQLRENLQKNIINLGDVRTIQEMSALGIGREYLQFLRLSNEELEKLNSLPIVSDDNLQKLYKYSQATKSLSNQWRVFKSEITARISIPLIEYMREIPDIAKDWTSSFQGIREISQPIIKFLQDSKVALYGLIGVAGIFSLAFAPVTSILVAFSAALKDIGDFSIGKDSFLGEIVEWFSSIYDPNRWLKLRMEKGLPVPEQALAQSGLDPKGLYRNYTIDNTNLMMENGSGVKGISTNNINNKNVVNNNTFNTQSMANPEEVARMVVEGLSELEAKSDLDNFPRGAIPELR